MLFHIHREVVYLVKRRESRCEKCNKPRRPQEFFKLSEEEQKTFVHECPGNLICQVCGKNGALLDCPHCLDYLCGEHMRMHLCTTLNYDQLERRNNNSQSGRKGGNKPAKKTNNENSSGNT